jgi:energy-coupling factor transporter ATP-binding protein EcfA2
MTSLKAPGSSSESRALIPYTPPVSPEEFIRSEIEKKTDAVFKQALGIAKYEHAHLRQISPGRIVLLLGQSTAGKSSILNELERTVPGALSAEQDAYQFQYNAKAIQEREPELYATMLKIFEPKSIAKSAWGFAGLQRVREGSSEEERDAAVRAVMTMREKTRAPSFKERENARIDHIITESLTRPLVGFDGCSDPREFLEHCASRVFSASVKIGLVYCPFKELVTRVAIRNEKALGPGGDPLEVRAAIDPIMQFADLYRPAQRGEVVLEVLKRTEIEEIFDASFDETISFLSAHRGGFCDIGDIDEHRTDRLNHRDQLKEHFMASLGFTDNSIKEVGITPRAQNFDYLFNTKEMSPSASAKMIQDWK